MAGTVSSAAVSTVSAVAPQVAKKVAEAAARNPQWIMDMPTRAIANVLLQQENNIMDHPSLYSEADKSGLMRSHRHFKQCLRMLKLQKRIAVICNGPEKPGSARLSFSVKLTRRGESIYTRYSKMTIPRAGQDDQPGLKDAVA